jgi:cobalamin biosynthesis Mg chelatase CobN
VVITLSGIFRDLLPLQVKLLAEAALLCAAGRRRSVERNFIRKHVLATMRRPAATWRRPRCACSRTPTARTVRT